MYASLLQLQQAKNLSFVRFFGKVFGTQADYYVAQGTYVEPPAPEDGAEEAPPPPGAPVEEAGTGCNAFVYFVCNDPAGEWTALPDVTPQQIVSSAKIRKFLTGSLGADVRAYPPFPGQEAAYLRALLARIVHATTLCPVGKYSLPEEGAPGDPLVDNSEGDEYSPAATAGLGSASGWCTRYLGVLDIGRTTNVPKEAEEEEEGAEPKGPQDQPEILPLAPVTDADWSTALYRHGGPAVAVARSVRWPGAYCAYKLVGKDETCTSLYIGYGHDALDAPFRMQPPPAFAAEPDDLTEQADPDLAVENEAHMATLKAQVAEEAAAMEDPPAEE